MITIEPSRAGRVAERIALGAAVLPAIVMVVRAVAERLGAAVRRRLLHRARPGRGHVTQPARRRLVDGLPGGRDVAQQPRAVAARRAGPVHQARPLLGHGSRRGGDEHRRHRRRVARQPPHPRIRRRCRSDGRHRRAAAQRGQPDAHRGPPAARPRTADVVHAVARRGDVDGPALGAAVARPGRQLRAPDALHLRLPDRGGRRGGDDRLRRPPSRRPGERGSADDPHRCGRRAVLGPTAVGSAVRHWQCRRRARTVGGIGAVRRRVAGPAHPRRVGVRATVLHPWLDGRPVARGTTAVAAGRRVRPCGVGGSTRRSGDRDAPPPPGAGRHGRDRQRRPSAGQSSLPSRSHPPSSSGSSPRTTTGAGRSPCSWRRRSPAASCAGRIGG